MSLSDIPRHVTDPPLHISQKIFDGHNDMLYQLWVRGDQTGQLFTDIDKDNPLSITYQRASEGGLAGGLFALFVPSNKTLEDTHKLSQPEAFQYTRDMLAIAHYLNDSHADKFCICRDANDITKAAQNRAIAAVLHIEGAEAISPSLEELYPLAEYGVRSIGPLWSRPNIFGHGVPFSYPGSPDQGDGLTPTGKALIAACDDANILVDVSHLNEAGFWDIAKISDQPLTASHSNAHSLCPSPRNLTDSQLDAIAERGGLVGVCFATAYLRKDGARDKNTEIDLILRQFDYLITRLGEGHVAFGSDFDGAVLPADLQHPADLPALLAAMQAYGFGRDLIAKLCWNNWLHRLS